jgi:hypothetical protein
MKHEKVRDLDWHIVTSLDAAVISQRNIKNCKLVM